MKIIRLLSPDDSVIREYAVPEIMHSYRMAKMMNPTSVFDSSDIAEVNVIAVDFVLDIEDTKFAQITEPNVYIYRQKGWLRDSGVLV